jgi:hypothetical protein
MPNVVVFFTGYSYDKHLETHISDIQFNTYSNWSRNQFVICSSNLLPPLSFRTYHPGYLNRLQREELSFNANSPLLYLLEKIPTI